MDLSARIQLVSNVAATLISGERYDRYSVEGGIDFARAVVDAREIVDQVEKQLDDAIVNEGVYRS